MEMQMTITKATTAKEIEAALKPMETESYEGEGGDFGVNSCPDAESFAALLVRVAEITEVVEVSISDTPEATLRFGNQQLPMDEALRLADVLRDFQADEFTVDGRSIEMWWD